MNTKRLFSVIGLMMVVLLGGACAAQPGEQTFGEQIVGTKQSTVPPTQVPPTVPPTQGMTTSTFALGWHEQWYRSPFQATTSALPDEATLETFAEPGVLLDATATFDRMSAAETPILCPEGGYAYLAVGEVTISHKGANLNLYHEENNVYLVIIRCNPDDGTPADRNEILMASSYIRGAGIYSPMPSGAYVSLGWMMQQITEAFRDPNCGRGCQKATIVVIDAPSRTYRMWQVRDAANPHNWKRAS